MATRLVFVDVDGTLVGRDGVPPCVWPKAEALRGKGVRFALVTGRPGRGETLGYAQRLDPQGLHIFESGAVVLALSQDAHTPLKVEALPEEAAREAVRLARRLGLPLEGYTAEGGFYVEGESPLLQDHQRLLGLQAEGADLLGLPSPWCASRSWQGSRPPWGRFWTGFPRGFRPTWRKAPRCRGCASSPSPGKG